MDIGSYEVVPPARFERTTPGLGKRPKVKGKMTDMTVVTRLTATREPFARSIQFPICLAKTQQTRSVVAEEVADGDEGLRVHIRDYPMTCTQP